MRKSSPEQRADSFFTKSLQKLLDIKLCHVTLELLLKELF